MMQRFVQHLQVFLCTYTACQNDCRCIVPSYGKDVIHTHCGLVVLCLWGGGRLWTPFLVYSLDLLDLKKMFSHLIKLEFYC